MISKDDRQADDKGRDIAIKVNQPGQSGDCIRDWQIVSDCLIERGQHRWRDDVSCRHQLKRNQGDIDEGRNRTENREVHLGDTDTGCRQQQLEGPIP